MEWIGTRWLKVVGTNSGVREPDTFEKEVQNLVAELKTSHTGFRHAGMRNIPARNAINATMQRLTVNGNERWMFQDVHPGGPAYSAGYGLETCCSAAVSETFDSRRANVFGRRVSEPTDRETSRRPADG